MRIVAFDPGRAKNRHAWTNEMKGAKSAQEIAHHSQEREEFSETRTRSFQENFILGFRTRWWQTRGWFGDGTVLVLHNLTSVLSLAKGEADHATMHMDGHCKRPYGSQRG